MLSSGAIAAGRIMFIFPSCTPSQMAVVYPGSDMPLILFSLVSHSRGTPVPSPRRKYHRLSATEPCNFYFEVVECGRRCLLTGALGGGAPYRRVKCRRSGDKSKTTDDHK